MRILYFGKLSDLSGAQEEDLACPAGVETTEALRSWLDLRFEAGGALLDATVNIAVNNEIVFGDQTLNEDDEIAFMPPVGGG